MIILIKATKQRRLKLQATCLLFLFPFFLSAQNIRRLSENEGLPQSFISGLVQDEQGFIWVGTRNGLARYDGHEFRIFQHNLSEKNSLSSNAITDIRLAQDNKLWIKFETGEIDRMDVNSEKVSHIVTQQTRDSKNLAIIQRGWTIDSSDIVWYLTKGGIIKRFAYVPGSGIKEKEAFTFPGDTIRSLLKNSKNEIWVLKQKGLSRFVASSGTFINYASPYVQYFNYNLDFGDDIPALHERANGELMWSDLKNIFFFQPSTRRYRKVKLPEPGEYSIKWVETGPDGNEYFMAGTSIYSYNDVRGLVRHTEKIQNFSAIQAFMVDRSGLIWTGGNTNGITQIDLATNFDSHSYTEDFVNDVLKNEFKFPPGYIPLSSNLYKGSLPLSYYLRSANDKKNTWIALNRNVYRYDLKSKNAECLKLPDDTSKKFNPVKGLTLDDEGNPIVMDQGGKLYFYDKKKFVAKAVKSTISSNPEGVDPNSIYFDNGLIWIATEYDGLFYIDLKNAVLHKVNSESFSAKCLYTMQPDPKRKELLWMGSPQGLLCFNKISFKITIFSVKQGLPDNVIYGILPDKSENLWLSTNKGLVCFDPVLHTSRTFTVSHGLPNNEFNRFHQILLPDNLMAFGGINGYVIFNPQEIKTDNFNPYTELTDIYINNVAIKHLAFSTSLKSLRELKLPYNENTLRIVYTALQFSHPQDIKYRYRLKGYDIKWIDATNNREAVYTKIPPGTYVFEVNATNTIGKWSHHVKSLQVTIAAPWWRSWWACLIYLLSFIASVILFINFRIRQRVMKQEIVLKQKEALRLREIDDMKMRFFTNITHELRTPLTLIIGPAEELKKKINDNDQQNLAEIITKNAGSLLNLTNQLLDMSKLEAGALQPHLSAGNLSEVISKTVTAFEQEASSKDIAMNLYLPDAAQYLFDPEMIERILFNLLSNAIRFSPAGGNIDITLKKPDSGVNIIVKDSGTGITTEDLPHIFSRFYRGNSIENKSASGSGIGLALVKELVALQGGNISVLPSADTSIGATFSVFLPLKNYVQYILKEEKEDIAGLVANPDMEKPLILIVEDNKELAGFIKSVLSPYYQVCNAENGITALPLATDLLPDIIISDVLMEGMDGFELCRTIKNNTITSHIPVVLLTAKSNMESKLEGLSYGADDYITKPFSVDELLVKINNRLTQQQFLRESIYRELTSLPQASNDKERPVTDPFLITLYEVIDKNIDDDSFGVEKLTVALSMSRTSLHRKIKSTTGMSTTEMLRAYRLGKALPLLKLNITIAEVAYKTGFGSPSYFTRSFKEVYGITPTDFLKTTKNKP